MHKDIDKEIVRDHIKAVIEEKTRQYADHLINKATLENKLTLHTPFLDGEKENFEKDLGYMAGKNEKQKEKYMSGLDDEYKKLMTKFVQQKNDISNLEYAEKGIAEHEEFLITLKSLGEEIEKEIGEKQSPSLSSYIKK